MSKKANAKAIGGFVIGAVMLAVIAVVVFGSEQFFQERQRFVMYFEGSVSGLDVGSPVQFRGVNVGTVAQVFAVYHSDSGEIQIPVLIDLVKGSVRTKGERLEPEEALEKLVDRGMRASLVVKSLVTGQRTIQMDFHPDTEVRLVETDLPYLQIPTIPSQMDEITRALSQDAPELIRTATATLNDVRALLNPENREEFHNILAGVDEMVTNINKNEVKIETFIDEATRAATEIAAAADQIRRVGDELERNPARFLFGDPGEKELR